MQQAKADGAGCRKTGHGAYSQVAEKPRHGQYSRYAAVSAGSHNRVFRGWQFLRREDEVLYRGSASRHRRKCQNAEDFLDETFLVISGDALTDIDLAGAVSFHRKGCRGDTGAQRVDVPLEYGVVVTDADGRIIRFIEKPGWGRCSAIR